MKTKAAKLFLIPILLVLIGFASYPISLKSSDGNEIIEVIILGNRRIETELIKSSITVSAGDILSSSAISNDIKNIFKLGFFDDVVAKIDKTEDGIVLIYKLKEKPTLCSIPGDPRPGEDWRRRVRRSPGNDAEGP